MRLVWSSLPGRRDNLAIPNFFDETLGRVQSRTRHFKSGCGKVLLSLTRGIAICQACSPSSCSLWASWLKAITRENRKIVLHSSIPTLPALVERAGERAAWRFLEFFTVNIRNNTRAAYGQDDFPLQKPWWLRLREKGGKVNKMGCHHKLEQYLDKYIAAAGIAEEKKDPLFRVAIGRTGKLAERSMSRVDAWYMVRRRARDAGIETALGNHPFRAIGITDYLERGGNINIAKRMGRSLERRNDGTLRLAQRRSEF